MSNKKDWVVNKHDGATGQTHQVGGRSTDGKNARDLAQRMHQQQDRGSSNWFTVHKTK